MPSVAVATVELPSCTDRARIQNGPPAAAPAVPENNDMKFDDINLNDTPKLDLDFGGLDGKDDKKSSGGGGFSFGGGWGGGWGSTGGGSSWGFGNADDQGAGKVDAMDAGWGFGSTAASSKKDKKKSTGFDFGLDDALGGDGFGASKVEEKPAEDDPWGSFGNKATAKKKGKKGAAMTFEPEPIIEAPPPPPPPVVPEAKPDDDPWGGELCRKRTVDRLGTDDADD